MRRIAITCVSLALAAAPLAASPAVAGETAPPTTGKPDVVAGRLLSPLSLAVTPQGRAWFSQNFAGKLMLVRPGSKPVVRYQARKPGTEVGAVSFRHGVVRFATTNANGGTKLLKRTRKGRIVSLANLYRYEKRVNPDGGATYGLLGLDEECAQGLPPFLQAYQGIVESHPYATLQRGRKTYVADAAANAIFSVRGGKVSTLAVLPPQSITITEEAAEANGLPPCTVGHDFAFEPVPTDVEMKGGMLYVTTLPGGPEDPSLGNRGAIHRIDPSTGDVTTVVTGLLSPTGLAIAPNGDMYVAELFRNRFSRVAAGDSTASAWATSSLPGDVEFRNGRVWGTRRVLTGLEPGQKPAGQVIRFPRQDAPVPTRSN